MEPGHDQGVGVRHTEGRQRRYLGPEDAGAHHRSQAAGHLRQHHHVSRSELEIHGVRATGPQDVHADSSRQSVQAGLDRCQVVPRERQCRTRALEQVDTGKVSNGTSVAAAKTSGRRGGSEAQHRDARVEASPAPSLLSLTAIAKSYGSVIALAGIDLRVSDGEIVTILGPSGSGKTTLLKIVAGFEFPDAGQVELAGDDITCVTPASRGIGMVFQNYALFPHMRVAENIAFPLEMRRLARAETQQRVGRALALVGLAGYEARYPRQLSGGQQQRVALARAIVFEPRLLLLDEPFGALDRKLREQMQLEVKRLQRRLGLTALFVTHDQEEALVLSDRIAVMSEGRVEQLGTPEEIYAHPVNWFVADFVGESNLFRGRLAADENGRPVALIAGGARLKVPASPFAIGSEIG